MKRTFWIIIIIILVILAWFFVRFVIGGDEDSWIKDFRGVYVKHGNPNQTPSYVLEQQQTIQQASQLYNQKKSDGMQFSSQCLGSVGDYAVDVVHVPRTEEDNLAENQCEDYRSGKVKHFIELDKQGEIVRII